jgi:hypothetical protein
MVGEYLQQVLGLMKTDLEMRLVGKSLESDNISEVVMRERLERAALLNMQCEVDYERYKLGRELENLRQTRGVVESKKATKFGGNPDVTKAVEMLVRERRKKAEKRVGRKAWDEKNRRGKGKEKAGEDEDKSV